MSIDIGGSYYFIGGYNYFKDVEFIEFIQGLDWICPGSVVLLLKHEQDDIKVYVLKDIITTVAYEQADEVTEDYDDVTAQLKAFL